MKCNAPLKHGGSVHVWASFVASDVGNSHYIEGTMIATSYIKLLKQNLHHRTEKVRLHGTFRLYQDADTQLWLSLGPVSPATVAGLELYRGPGISWTANCINNPLSSALS